MHIDTGKRPTADITFTFKMLANNWFHRPSIHSADEPGRYASANLAGIVGLPDMEKGGPPPYARTGLATATGALPI